MRLSFTKASLSQHVAIDRLMRDAFTPYVKKLGRGLIAGPDPWLEAAIGRGDIYVGLDETEIVGVVATSRQGDELVINRLAVDPPRQGAGIGSWLLDQIEQTARSAITISPPANTFFMSVCGTNQILGSRAQDRYSELRIWLRIAYPS